MKIYTWMLPATTGERIGRWLLTYVLLGPTIGLVGAVVGFAFAPQLWAKLEEPNDEG